MNEKDKARELVDIFLSIEDSKQCAIFCVNEIIELLYKLSDISSFVVDERDYYERIKQEIEKL